jgi:RHS repeat-associated protein
MLRGDSPGQARNEAASPLAPSISLPKGGGAIRGIGETFAANPVTGTASITVPIAASPGRSGFGPQLALSYDSGSGNGPFGFGWTLGSPAITRKTDKGLPRYRDRDESDVFILSGVEDLLPVLVEDESGEWGRQQLPVRTVNAAEYQIDRYRPRIEGLFARIERWSNTADPSDCFWRSISRDNITTWYGRTAESRIADPADPARIFSWLICETHDDKGNVIVYRYKEENSDGVLDVKVHERNRSQDARRANRYLKRIRYGNRLPYLPQLSSTEPWPAPAGATEVDASAHWLFELVFDYGEHDLQVPTPSGSATWTLRNDPFSSYRASFEVRTYRLCQRVLMFHHFPNEADIGADCLVRSTDFTYSYEDNDPDPRDPIFSFLRSVVHTGYKRRPGGYLLRSLPPLELEYTEPVVQQDVHEVDSASIENLPYGLDNGTYQWVDLDGEGLSGVLSEQGEGWFYKRNLSPVSPSNVPAVRFAAVEQIASKPSLAAPDATRQQFLDLGGDGQVDLVDFEAPTPGFFERTPDEGWASFAPFSSLPTLDWRDPNLRFVDLTGDGHADILITGEEIFSWYPSLAEAGFGPAQIVRNALEEDRGPRVVFADTTQSVYLADLSGDGLSDVVRISNGDVCYWPNLGYGRFGAKVTMDNAPWFEASDLFDQQRIRLADIDGSGLTDIIYLGHDGVDLYFNQSGNSWSDPRRLTAFPAVDNLATVHVADLLGNGTACLVWSSSLPGDARRPIRYVDLMGGQKPHLMIRSVNNLGADTRVQYASSTRYYLQDKLAGRPWISRLAFPVHVVDRVETNDFVSRNRFVTRYEYHHGYFDGEEREFRGFGMVEQRDTEVFGAFTAAGELPAAANLDEASHVPPVLTRTWFHTGVYLGRERISKLFEDEYYREPGVSDEQAHSLLLDDTALPHGLTADDEREACRALKGSMLRQEVYAIDGTVTGQHPFGQPFTVNEQSFTVEQVQPRAGNRHGAFFAHGREAVSYHYERHPGDPRVRHALTLQVDPFGNVERSLEIAYPRRALPAREPEQAATHMTLTVSRFANRATEADWYRAGVPVGAQTYEVVNASEPAVTASSVARFGFDTIRQEMTLLFPPDQTAPDEDTTWPYEKWDWRTNTANAPPDERLRLIELTRSRYRRDDLTGPLPFGDVQALALPWENYTLAFTPSLLASVYSRALDGQPPQPLIAQPESVLGGQGADQGAYIDLDADGRWWIPSGQLFFAPDVNIGDPAATATQEWQQARTHFFQPRLSVDPFGSTNRVDYDAYDLKVTTIQDAVGNTIAAVSDYRVLQPTLLTDANGNRSQVAFDAIGLVVGTAIQGKDDTVGDSLAGFNPDPTQAEIDGFMDADDPHPIAVNLLQGATTRIVYDLDRFRRTQQEQPAHAASWLPAYAATVHRETHLSDPLPADGLRLQVSFSYSDGFGREIQKKIQAEPGPVVDGGPVVSPRWVGSGWTIFNNKGNPVRQYEPFFSQLPARGHLFEFGVEVGVSPVLFYDPVDRVVATLHPNHTYEKVVFTAWRQDTWDVNDTVLLDPRTDADVSALTKRYFSALNLPPGEWQTWYEARSGGALGPEEQAAASKTALHAGTTAVAHVDVSGRAFLSIAHNRFTPIEAPPGALPTDEFHRTRLIFDSEGNQREIVDALARTIMRYDYDMRGGRSRQVSLDAGERWMLNDVTGKRIRAWDGRGHVFRMEYDLVRRPRRVFVRGATPQNPDHDLLFQQTEYGEGQPNDRLLNLRTRAFRSFDGAGLVTNIGHNSVTGQDEAYDFKGNLLRSSRQLTESYTTTADWQASPSLAPDVYVSSTTYDALNRAVTMTMPDASVVRRSYNAAKQLERIEGHLRGAATATPFVTEIDYNAKGQRTAIAYGNGVTTRYDYDPFTFRLASLRTFRAAEPLQDLSYTYDPAGNVTSVRDQAQQTIYFNNAVVEPHADYAYDAIYRLISATGREHIGQAGNNLPGHHPELKPQYDFNDSTRTGLAHPHDGQAMRSYTQRYVYDEVGNFERIVHQAAAGNWTRRYAYQPGSNRLLSTSMPGDPDDGPPPQRYIHDVHGNMTSMPHLAQMDWDFEEQLRRVDLGGGGTAYYVYDSDGQRIRKVWEKSPGLVEERIYLGAFEVFRRRGVGGVIVLERDTAQIVDDTRRVALIETRTQGNDGSPTQLTRFQFGNHLGSASLEIDGEAHIISYEEYSPFGSTSYQGVRAGTEVNVKRYRYAGKERDEESGFYYYGARYYASWLGRWTSCDPVDRWGGLEGRYTFARNRPTTLVDVEGRDPAPPNAARMSADEINQRYAGTAKDEAHARAAAGEPQPPPVRDAKPFSQRASDFYSQDSLRCYKPTEENLARVRSERFEAMRRDMEREEQERVDDRPDPVDVNEELGEAATNVGIGEGGQLPPGFLQEPGAMRGVGAAATRQAAVASVRSRAAELKEKLKELGEIEEQMRTIGVKAVRTDDGGYRLVVTTSHRDPAFENQVRGWLRPGEAYLRAKENRGDTSHHAEQVDPEGIPDDRILATGATKDICTGCQQRIRQSGSVPATDIHERVPPMRINMVRERGPRPVRVNLLNPRVAPAPRTVPRLPVRSK